MLSMEGGTTPINMTENEKIYDEHDKMSDIELIQSLKYCTDDSIQTCKLCPFYGNMRCVGNLMKLATVRLEGILLNEEACLSLLMKAHDELRAAKSCEICIHKDHCDPRAPYESPQWKMWRTCGEVEKKNYRWRGDKE